MIIELLHITPNAEAHIETCGRICYNSKATCNTQAPFIKALIKRGHESVLEHATASFKISGISRACTHQLIRHRLASYSQKSQRYVKEDMFEYVIPPSIQQLDVYEIQKYKNQMTQIQDMYNYWKTLGISNEDARMVLPNACTTEIAMTANFREWRTIFNLRCSPKAQWEIQDMARQMLEMLYKECPIVFEDLYNKYNKKN